MTNLLYPTGSEMMEVKPVGSGTRNGDAIATRGGPRKACSGSIPDTSVSSAVEREDIGSGVRFESGVRQSDSYQSIVGSDTFELEVLWQFDLDEELESGTDEMNVRVILVCHVAGECFGRAQEYPVYAFRADTKAPIPLCAYRREKAEDELDEAMAEWRNQR